MKKSKGKMIRVAIPTPPPKAHIKVKKIPIIEAVTFDFICCSLIRRSGRKFTSKKDKTFMVLSSVKMWKTNQEGFSLHAFCIRVIHLFLPLTSIPHASAGVLPPSP